MYVDVPPNYNVKVVDVNLMDYDLLLFSEERLIETNDLLLEYVKSESEAVRTIKSQDFPVVILRGVPRSRDS